MRLRTAVAVALTVLVTAPPAAAKPYPEPKPGPWAYDQYGNTAFKAGSFRVKPGSATKPPRVARFRLGLDVARGRCPALGTKVAVAGPVGLEPRPDLAGNDTRNVWAVDDAEVRVSVAGRDPVTGRLALQLLQSFEGGRWRWVVWYTELEVGACTLTPISGRPRG